MKAGLAALIDALDVRSRLQRENLKTIQWYRHNATVRRDLPGLPDDSDSGVTGMLNALAIGTRTGGNSGGATGGTTDAGAATGNPPAQGSTGTATADTGRRESDSERGGITINASGGGAAPATHSGGDAANPGLWQTALMKYLVGAALAGSGLGAGVAISQHFAGGDTAVETNEGEYPLLDWLEEQGKHLRTSDGENIHGDG